MLTPSKHQFYTFFDSCYCLLPINRAGVGCPKCVNMPTGFLRMKFPLKSLNNCHAAESICFLYRKGSISSTHAVCIPPWQVLINPLTDKCLGACYSRRDICTVVADRTAAIVIKIWVQNRKKTSRWNFIKCLIIAWSFWSPWEISVGLGLQNSNSQLL